MRQPKALLALGNMKAAPSFLALLLKLVLADDTQAAPWETTTTPAPGVEVVHVEVLPRLTPKEHAEDLASEAERASTMAAASEQVAREHLQAARAGRLAYQHELTALKGEIAASEIGTEITKRVEKVRKLRSKTLAAARHTGQLIDEIPKLIERGVQRAVEDTVADALKELDQKKTDVAGKAQEKVDKAAAAASIPEAVEAPKLEVDLSTADSYSDAAQKVALRANAMKKRSMELANQAVQYQKQAGNMNMAQKLMLSAHELMDKAVDIGDEAQMYGNVASLVSREQGTLKKLHEASQLPDMPEVVPMKVPPAPC